MDSEYLRKLWLILVPVPLNIGSLEELQAEETGQPATKRFRIQGQDGQSFVLTVAGKLEYCIFYSTCISAQGFFSTYSRL